MSHESETTGMEIALIGMSCRFPGANNAEQFWRNLVGGVESLTRFTVKELETLGEDPAVVGQPTYVPVSRMVDDIEHFDASFFGFNPREAEVLDPQHRMFMECCWEALEDSGYDPEAFPGLIGLYAGSRQSYYLMNIFRNPQILAAVGDFQAQISNQQDYVATRVSYKLNLGGPSMTVQTACSTALVATHVACQALLAGECDLALAGAVSVRVPQHQGYLFRDGDVGSPDGRCYAFDSRAKGTIFGSGLGAVVLKRLEDAIADRDHIYSVIKGSAVANDGSVKVGFTAPGADGQARVIRAAQVVSGVDPESISYVEAHGTGTPLGDPIEVSALTRAFREKTDKRGFCAIGSAKPNIGHAGAAAGVAGLIKASLALKHRLIPPSILYEKPNPEIDFEDSPFYVNTQLAEWKSDGAPRRCGLSAFGIGGTNGHLILEEAPAEEAGDAPGRSHELLLLSARTATALDTATARLADYLDAAADRSAEHFADVAHTLQLGRRPMEHRRVLVAANAEDAAAALRTLDPQRLRSGLTLGKNPPVTFLFSGQGAQYLEMGAGLYREEPRFREEVDRCSELLMPHLGRDLRGLLYPPAEQAEAAARDLGETAHTQPALFVIEYALARLWMSWGVQPQAMIGHSIGEYVAACLAGVMSLEAALRLVAVRGRLMQSLPAGAMLSVSLPEAELAPWLGTELSVAAINSPGRAVISGPEAAVAAVEEQLAAQGIACRRLHTSHAFHSQMMEPILAPFQAELEKVELKAPQLPFLSNSSGTWITDAEATDPGYWVRHLRGTVRFADNLSALFEKQAGVLLEVGPGKTLATFARQHTAKPEKLAILSSLRHPQETSPDLPNLLSVLGQLWSHGVKVDWRAFRGEESRRRLSLPTYPFERRRFWIDPTPGVDFGAMTGGPRRSQDLSEWFYLPSWQPSLPLAPAARVPGRWLLFADETGLAERLAGRLEAEGREVITVRPGPGFQRLDENRFELAPGNREDYLSLLSDLKAAERLPDAIAHLWGVTGGEGGPVPEPELEPTADRGFWSLLYLAQAIGKHAGGRNIHLGVVADRLQRVQPGDVPCPEKATALGPCKVIAQEYPDVSVVSVDVVWSAESAEGEDAVVAQVYAEVAAPVSTEPVVAYRGASRWVQSYQAVRLAEAVKPVRLRHEGVYLITGGLGGFGLSFAEYLGREHKARLVLIGRSELPERAEWHSWIAEHGPADSTRRKLEELLAIEAAGGEVLALSADVTDPASLRKVVEQAQLRFGPIHGVVHAAGVAGGGLIQLKTREVAERVLAPKVQGVRAIEAALAGQPLDFLMLCSSNIAVLGSLGQVDYCAANNYMDAYAQARNARPARPGEGVVLSVNWGAWQEVGMAVNTPAPPSAAAALGAAPGAPEAAAPVRQPLAVDKPLHALLDLEIADDDAHFVFATEFSSSRHWVLNEHRIVGKPAIPGTTWLEVARAGFNHQFGPGPVEIRDLIFRTPLILPEGESNEARFHFEREGDAYVFRITSRVPELGGDSWQEHARGKVSALADGAGPRRRNLDELRALCDQGVLGRDTEGKAAEGLVYWGPRWQSVREVRTGDNRALAQLELPEEFLGDIGEFGLHPALVDVATAFASASIKDDRYLPLSYQRVRVHGPVPAKVYSYIERTGDLTSRETIRFNVSLLGEDGTEWVGVEGFTMKRVGAAVSRFKEERPAAAPAPAGSPEAPAAPQGLFAPGGMSPEEGVEVFRRLLSLPPLPQIIVSPRDLVALLEINRSVTRSKILEAADKARASATAHPRPNLPVAYLAPRNETEGKLADIWQRALGIEQVGVNDNFFDLGGDSVLGVQVISRCTEAGLQLSPEQLFEHQTIAELATVLESAEAAPAETPETTDLPDPGLNPLELDKIFAKLEGMAS